MELRARATRLGRLSADPVAPFARRPATSTTGAEARAGGARADGGGPIATPWRWRDPGAGAPDRPRPDRAARWWSCAAPAASAPSALYRGLPDAVHGMIAWPNTVLLTGPEAVVVDPGYQTQGDMLAGALAARGLSPDDVRTVLATHLHSDHVSALPAARRGGAGTSTRPSWPRPTRPPAAGLARPGDRAAPDGACRARCCRACAGSTRPGTPTATSPTWSTREAGPVAIAGDTPGPDPSWFAEGRLPDDHPRRDEHLAAFRAIRESGPTVVIPGHNPPRWRSRTAPPDERVRRGRRETPTESAVRRRTREELRESIAHPRAEDARRRGRGRPLHHQPVLPLVRASATSTSAATTSSPRGGSC